MTSHFFAASPHVRCVLAFVVLLTSAASAAAPRERARRAGNVSPLTTVEVKEPDGQILSYRHLATSTEVHMRGTRRASEARIKVKVGSRPGFVELDINRNGISGLKPAYLLGKDFLTYVLWAVSVDGKASNLGEITFEDERAIPVNVTTTYQTFWLMVTAEPNYAVVDPSPVVVLYSVKQGSEVDKGAIPIDRPLFFFTHYANYTSTKGGSLPAIPNQLLQARKAVELTSRSGARSIAPSAEEEDSKEAEYTREAISQAHAFLKLAEQAYADDPRGKGVVQFARTAAQSAENARALATGAVGGLLVRELEKEVERLRAEVAQLRVRDVPRAPIAPQAVLTVTTRDSSAERPTRGTFGTLVRQPALWFAVSGWGVAIVLLFRRRSV